MSALEMLTKAADLVENQDEQKRRLMESLSPSSDKNHNSNHIAETNVENHKYRESERNGKCESSDHEDKEHTASSTLQNGQHEVKKNPEVEKGKASNLNGHGIKDELTKNQEEILRNHRANDRNSNENVNPHLHQQQLYQQYLLEHSSTNGNKPRHLGEQQPRDNRTPTRPSPERYHQPDRQSTSPNSDRSGDKVPLTKPMVLLQHPSAATLSSVGSSLPVPGTHHTVLPAGTMHHPFLYPMMYPAGTSLDPLARGPGNTPKEGESHVTSPNGSPNVTMSSVTAPMQLPAGYMYPFGANPALMMGARAAGGLGDISPFLLAQSTAYAGTAGLPPNLSMLDQYKRLIEGMHALPTYSLQPHLADQYLKSLMPQGLDGVKDPLTLAALGGRPPPGISLASLQGQPGANELWLRYPEQFNAAGVIRSHEGMSPRSVSPYTNKRRSESPVAPNGTKLTTTGYPFHGSLPQVPNSLIGSRTHARSPASIFSHGQRSSRSPHPEARKPDIERAGFPSHSRDHEPKSVGREMTSASSSASHNRGEHGNTFSITDEAGRKISVPSFYSPGSLHVQHGYPMSLPGMHTGHERSPSPQSRASEDPRGYRRASRERSPGGDHHPNKRRSLDNQYVARHSPAPNERHNSRSSSPATNGQIPTSRHQLPLVNGSAEAAAEFAKANPHLLLPMGLRGSPVYGEARDPNSGSPAASPYLAGALPPYFGQPSFISGLAGAAAAPYFLPHYAALANTGKGCELTAASLASLYKSSENGPEYSRIHGLSTMGMALPLLPQQQQQIMTAAGRPLLAQEYAAALKSHPYFAGQAAAATVKETGKASPVSSRDKLPAIPPTLHPSLLGQQPGPAQSPSSTAALKSKHSSPKQGHASTKGGAPHIRVPDSHSPTPNVNLNNNILSTPDGRRYLSPQTVAFNERQARENSPKPTNKHYRPNPMLHQHAEDLADHRNRKLKRKIDDEIAVGEEASNFLRGKQHLHPRPEQQREKSQQVKEMSKKDPKRRKQIATDVADPDIEEHFRRSLGKDYKMPETHNKVSITGAVDDHFKKALGGEVWNKLQTTTSVTVKNEARDVASLTTHVLPSYSVALASARPYPYDVKPPISRRYPEPHFSRERYHIQNMNGPPSHHRRPAKSPPDTRTGAPGSTVLYPNQPAVPASHRVKAKAVVFPESAPVMPDINNRGPRAPSLGSKGSSRTISGSSAESLPSHHSKRSPSPMQPAVTTTSSYSDDVSHPPIPVAIHPAYPYGHLPQATAPISTPNSSIPPTTASQSHMKSSGSSSSLHRVSPSLNPSNSAEEPPRNSPASVYATKEAAAVPEENRKSTDSGRNSS